MSFLDRLNDMVFGKGASRALGKVCTHEQDVDRVVFNDFTKTMGRLLNEGKAIRLKYEEADKALRRIYEQNVGGAHFMDSCTPYCHTVHVTYCPNCPDSEK